MSWTPFYTTSQSGPRDQIGIIPAPQYLANSLYDAFLIISRLLQNCAFGLIFQRKNTQNNASWAIIPTLGSLLFDRDERPGTENDPKAGERTSQETRNTQALNLLNYNTISHEP